MNYNFITSFRGVWAIEPTSIATSILAVVAAVKTGNLDIIKLEEKRPFILPVTNKSGKINKVSILPMIGPLFKESDSRFGIIGDRERGQWLKNAYNDKEIDAIVLETETPGGTVDGTEEFEEILQKRNKPVVQFVNGMSCSKGVWLGSNCDEIIAATNYTEIGSIGVMISHTDFIGVFEKWGAKSHHVVADQSPDKSKTFLDLLKGEYATIKKEALNPLADAFISTVKKNRPEVKDNQLTGKVFFAKDLVGTLIDGIGNLDYAMKRALALLKPEVKTIKI